MPDESQFRTGRMMGVKKLGEPGNTILEFPGTGYIFVLENIFTHYAPRITNSVQVGQTCQTAFFKSGNIFFEKLFHPDYLLMLFDDLPGQIFDIQVSSVKTMSGHDAYISIVQWSWRHRVDQRRREDKKGQVAVLHRLFFELSDE
jgi:hypothetical protein